MRLSEIINIDDIDGGFPPDERDILLKFRWEDIKSKIKFIDQLPNGFDVWGNRWPLTRDYNQMYFLENDEVVGSAMVHLKDPPMPNKTVTIKMINVLSTYQKRGIGFEFYSFLLKNGYKILSDMDHTKGSRKLWNKLSKVYTARFYDLKTEKFSDPVNDINKAYRTKHLKILLTK